MRRVSLVLATLVTAGAVTSSLAYQTPAADAAYGYCLVRVYAPKKPYVSASWAGARHHIFGCYNVVYSGDYMCIRSGVHGPSCRQVFGYPGLDDQSTIDLAVGTHTYWSWGNVYVQTGGGGPPGAVKTIAGPTRRIAYSGGFRGFGGPKDGYFPSPTYVINDEYGEDIVEGW